MANLAFRTFDWLLAERIASHEFNADQLDQDHRHKVLLGIYPDQSTALHMIASKTTSITESRSVDQLKSLLEPDQELSEAEFTESAGVDFFKVPIIVNENGLSPFR